MVLTGISILAAQMGTVIRKLGFSSQQHHTIHPSSNSSALFLLGLGPRLGTGCLLTRDASPETADRGLTIRFCQTPLMVKKLIFASKGGEFPRPQAHAASRS